MGLVLALNRQQGAYASSWITPHWKVHSHNWDEGQRFDRHVRWLYKGYAIYALLPFESYLVANAKEKRGVSAVNQLRVKIPQN
jgi:hypothetical protein